MGKLPDADAVSALAQILQDLMLAHPCQTTLPYEYVRSSISGAQLGRHQGGVNVMMSYAYTAQPEEMVRIAKKNSHAPHDQIDAAYALLFT